MIVPAVVVQVTPPEALTTVAVSCAVVPAISEAGAPEIATAAAWVEPTLSVTVAVRLVRG